MSSEPIVTPQNPDAELSVVGAMLQGRRPTENVLEVLEPDGHSKFFAGRAKLVYGASRALYLEGKEPDPVLISEQLKQVGKLEEAGGIDYLRLAASTVPATANVKHHAEVVRETWQKRMLFLTFAELYDTSRDGVPSAEMLELAERKLLDVRALLERGRPNIVTSAEAAVAVADKLRDPPDEMTGIRTPFRFLRPLKPGRLHVLGGYPGDGKTALAVQFLRAAAVEGHKVGFVSIEMSWEDLSDRIVASFGIPHRQVMAGKVHEPHRLTAERALKAMTTWRVDLIDDEAANATAIWRYQKLGGYDFLIVDHLHRIDWEDRRQLEREVRAITNLARGEQIPILLLSQLHRRGDDFPRPTIASFRESGVIEQEASLGFAIWRERDPETKLPTPNAEFLVLKNRYGCPGSYPLHFREAETRFVEEDRE